MENEKDVFDQMSDFIEDALKNPKCDPILRVQLLVMRWNLGYIRKIMARAMGLKCQAQSKADHERGA